jgi:hypothetical protein
MIAGSSHAAPLNTDTDSTTMSNQHPTGSEHSDADEPAFSARRRQVGLDATYEIEALINVIRDLSEGLGTTNQAHEELMALQLKIRGITARIEDLNGVSMSLLDEDESTVDLHRRVYGCRRGPSEAALHD